MPVKLFTGLPGAGKTACLVAEIIAMREKEPERPIYQRGINGLAEGIALNITDDELHHWREALSPGAIICIDECQEDGLMPLDKGQPAKWVKDLSKVRHEGMDFLLTTQHPSLMSAYVRKLVDQHVHAVRKFNTKVVGRYTWGRCMDTPEKASTQKAATSTVGTLPKEVFDLYKSASMHTMKKRIPPKVYVLAGCGIALVCAVVSVPIVLSRMDASAHGIAGTPAASGASSSSRAPSTLRTDNYVAWLRPRIDGLPWTAPAYDDLDVRSQPRVYCIASTEPACKCISDQGTPVVMEADTCRSIAANGVYNPFVEPRRDQDRERNSDRKRRQREAPDANSALPTQQATALPSVATAGGNRTGIATPYTPPGYGPWNSDPFGGDSKQK